MTGLEPNDAGENDGVSEIDETVEPEGEAPTGEAFIDILSSKSLRPTAKNQLIQKVLLQLIETYGFDRDDLAIAYHPEKRTSSRDVIDIVIFRPGADHTDANIQRIITCQPQKKAAKLRSFPEAEPDLERLKGLLQMLPTCRFGMWTNGLEEFFIQAEAARFETQFRPLGAWPAPGEATEDVDRTGGVVQVGADGGALYDALERCYQYLNRNLGLDHKDAFKQLAVLMLAKVYDERQPVAQRRFWIRGDEPFTAEGQAAIQQRIINCVADAVRWHPGVLASGWAIYLDAAQTARLVMEIARYSLSETHPSTRTRAYRSIVRTVMDGREGRYPTPLNVAEMAVQMLDPQPEERVIDCCSGTGTFLAIAGVHIYDHFLVGTGTNWAVASSEQHLGAQAQTAEWARQYAFGCEIDPFLAVTTRLNLLLTAGDPGNVFRLDSRSFPQGELDGVAAGAQAAPLGSMDVVLTNPWFSTQPEDVVTDKTLLSQFDLGDVWERTEDGEYRNTGRPNTAGVPPEVLLLERAISWAKPGTGRVGILLPDGLLGNPSDEYIRWWILRHCEVLASADLPLEPFKATIKAYRITPALSSFLVLRRRSQQELYQPTRPEYEVFMAIAESAGVDRRGNPIYQRSPEGDLLLLEAETTERVRVGEDVRLRTVRRKSPRINDELPAIAEHFQHFQQARRAGR
jgi:type I restriction enzyme M protein